MDVVQGKAATWGGVERKWWVLLSVGVGTFMTALDGSVVNIVLPVVSRAFGSDVATVEWVVTIYLLMVSGLLLSFGRLGDMRGHKSVYLSGFWIFVISSALCGLSPSAGALVGFRALQALGAAMLMSNSPAILTRNFPPTQRGQALGLQATMTYLGLMVGPSLGGWLATQWSWRSVFYINVPVGALALWLGWRFIPAAPPLESERAERFDLWGAGLFMGGLVALMLGLNQGHAWGWISPAILALLGAAAVLLVAFLAVEARVPSPMLDLSLFRARVFSASAASAVLNYVGLYTVVFLLPFYLIQVRGLVAAQAGLILTAQPIVMALAAPLSGTLSDRVGARWLSTPGMVIMALGLFLLSRVGVDTPLQMVALSLAVVGLGIGMFVSPNTSALLGAAPLHRRGVASGVLATARNVGMVLGVGMAGAILTTMQAQAVNLDVGTFDGIRAGFLAAVGVALLAALASAVRGSSAPE